jgi:tRNA(fMet)-specific endonuclease VapC
MIVLDNDVLVKLGGADYDEDVVSHLQRYSHEEWTIPAIVAFEFYKSCEGRAEIQRARQRLTSAIDRIVDFTHDTAVEAAYLDELLTAQGVSLAPADLLNLAIAYEAGGTFVTHSRNDFDKAPLHGIADIDVIHTS